MQAARRIAIIGTGPMGIYLLKHLTESRVPLDITLFEADAEAGTGMPYRRGMNADFMMANIFSREIPLIVDTLADWLRSRPAAFLAEWGLSRDAISGRDFYPRTLLGLYLQAQLDQLITRAQAAGHKVAVQAGQRVQDIQPVDGGFAVSGGHAGTFAKVIIATGHVWDAAPTEGDATLISPWPATQIEHLPPAAISILGSALSAVDVAVALARSHGRFDADGDGLVWHAHPGHEKLTITMVSRNGILPEADFFYPYPYEPLVHLTDDAMRAMIAARPGDTLQGAFDLLMQELQACDPDYLTGLAMPEVSVEAFGAAYFARRQKLGAFRALRLNLAESRRTIAQERTVAWRYALLRGHEAFEHVLPHMTAAEWDRFRTHLLPVFADCYAAVPHLSLDRLAALHAAGVIDIVDCGDAAEFADTPEGGVTVTVEGQVLQFACMIDARGQKAAGLADLPFPSLVAALSDPAADLGEDFALHLRASQSGGVTCLAMPQVLLRNPFAQGLPNCHDLAERVAARIVGP